MKLDAHSARSVHGEGEITHRRNVEILTEYSQREPAGKRRRVVLRFLRSPVAIHGNGKVEAIEFVRNELHHGSDGTLRARPTGDHETLEAGLVFRSIGYRGVPIDGVPFDEWKGEIPNEEGRIVDPHEQHAIPGEYAVGWIKRGPSGVIGTNKRDAQETVDHLLEDLAEGRLPEPADPDPAADRNAHRGAPARLRELRRLAGHRRRRGGRRGAARAPAREVHERGGDAGGGARTRPAETRLLAAGPLARGSGHSAASADEVLWATLPRRLRTPRGSCGAWPTAII